MVCNTCGKQMKQYKGIGGGSMSPANYNTWEVKYCDDCDDYILEEYVAMRVTKDDIDKYIAFSKGDYSIPPLPYRKNREKTAKTGGKRGKTGKQRRNVQGRGGVRPWYNPALMDVCFRSLIAGKRFLRNG